jgi:hypothetical protein
MATIEIGARVVALTTDGEIGYRGTYLGLGDVAAWNRSVRVAFVSPDDKRLDDPMEAAPGIVLPEDGYNAGTAVAVDGSVYHGGEWCEACSVR